MTGSATPTSGHDAGRPTSRCSSSARSSPCSSASGRRPSRRSTSTCSGPSTTSPGTWSASPRASTRSVRSGPCSRSRSCCCSCASAASRCTPCSRVPARGACRSCSTTCSGHTPISGLGVNVRIGDGPVYPVANVGRHHRARVRHRAVHRATAATHLRRRHRPGVHGRDVPRRRLPVRRHRRAVGRVRDRGARSGWCSAHPAVQPSVAEVRAALADLGYDVVTIAPAAGDGPIARR